MKSWRVKYEVKNIRGMIEHSNYLRIQFGVLQGDSFSPLLFCLAMVPITRALNNTKCDYKTASGKLNKMQLTLSHQFYMDDLKLYADSEKSLKMLLRTVETISSAISMKVNLKKCATAHYVPKRLRNEGIKNKYLGIDQEFNTKESFTWKRVKDRCIVKFKKIWVSNLSETPSKNLQYTHGRTFVPEQI